MDEEMCPLTWWRGEVVWWGQALEAYGKAAPFGEVAAEERARRLAAQEAAE